MPALTPYLMVESARPFVDFLTDAFDAEATFTRAVAGGAQPIMEVATQGDGSRMGAVMAFGALWWVNTAA